MDNNALMQKMLDAINTQFHAMGKRFDAVDRRLDAMDKRFDAVDKRFDAMDKRVDSIEGTVKATQLAVNVLAEDVKDIKTHLRFHDLKFMEQDKKIYKLEGRNWRPMGRFLWEKHRGPCRSLLSCHRSFTAE